MRDEDGRSWTYFTLWIEWKKHWKLWITKAATVYVDVAQERHEFISSFRRCVFRIWMRFDTCGESIFCIADAFQAASRCNGCHRSLRQTIKRNVGRERVKGYRVKGANGKMGRNDGHLNTKRRWHSFQIIALLPVCIYLCRLFKGYSLLHFVADIRLYSALRLARSRWVFLIVRLIYSSMMCIMHSCFGEEKWKYSNEMQIGSCS